VVRTLSTSVKPPSRAAESRRMSRGNGFGQLGQEGLAESEQRYRKLVELLPDAVVVHRDGRLVFVNAAAVRLMRARGPEDLVGRPVLDIVHPDFHEVVLKRVRREIDDRVDVPPIEERFVRLDGTEVEVEVAGAAITYGGHRAGLVVVRDATERKRAEEAVRRSEQAASEAEARYRALVEHVPAIIYIWDFHDGFDRAKVAYVSPQIERVLGFPPQAFSADAAFWFERTHPEDRAAVVGETARSVEAGEPFEMEYRMIHRDDRVVWVRDNASALLQAEQGRVLLHQGIVVDITEGVRMREELGTRLDELRRVDAERRRLVSRLVAAQEDERRRIAANIHDDPVQKIAAAGTRLDIMASARPELVDEPTYKVARQSLRDAIESLRHLMFNVQPYSLDRAGDLELALRALGEVEASADATTSYEVRWNSRPSLPPELATVLYRIAQEAVANARKHAMASRVIVSIVDEGDGIRLRVEDDGVGFSDAAGASPPGHLGLTTMRERAEIAGGTFLVRSTPGTGTCVEIRLPL
jgi:PAS domain S-box-containing protein